MSFKVLKMLCCLMTAAVVLTMVSCKGGGKDDNTMTNEIIQKHFAALTSYDVKAFNENSLCRFDELGDNDSIKAACKQAAAKCSWELEGISINGNTAVAQLDIDIPVNIDEVCKNALDDVMLQLDSTSGSSPNSMLNNALKKRLSELKTERTAIEVTMNKVNNKWYIAEDYEAIEIMSDIRTAVAAVHSYLKNV